MALCFQATTSDLATTASIHIPWVLVRNPYGSGITVRIRAIYNSTCVSSGNHIFRAFLSPVVTNVGVLLPSVSLYTKYVAYTPKALIYSKPTVSGYGNQFSTVISGPTYTTMQSFDDSTLVLAAGYDLLISCRANTGSLTASTDVYWFEP